jgi:hypothetical protein
MLCTFTISNAINAPVRVLIIRSEDIKIIRDTPQGTVLYWQVGTEIMTEMVTDTARENMDRLQREEIEAVMRVNAMQQQFQMQPQIPASLRPRGKVRT